MIKCIPFSLTKSHNKSHVLESGKPRHRESEREREREKARKRERERERKHTFKPVLVSALTYTGLQSGHTFSCHSQGTLETNVNNCLKTKIHTTVALSSVSNTAETNSLSSL